MHTLYCNDKIFLNRQKCFGMDLIEIIHGGTPPVVGSKTYCFFTLESQRGPVNDFCSTLSGIALKSRTSDPASQKQAS